MHARILILSLVAFGCSKQASAPEPSDPTASTPAPAPEGEPSPTTTEGEPSPATDDGGEGAPCKPTGCSGIVCSDEEVMTTCEYRPEYECYKTATCTRQPDGECGWTQTPELDACLKDPPPMK